MQRWLLRAVIALAILVAIAVVGVYVFLRRSLPQTDGTITVSGIINAGGCGGTQGDATHGGGGGGSGGAVLLEAPTVHVTATGVLAANGGGGGGGGDAAATAGEAGRPNDTRASGGAGGSVTDTMAGGGGGGYGLAGGIGGKHGGNQGAVGPVTGTTAITEQAIANTAKPRHWKAWNLTNLFLLYGSTTKKTIAGMIVM